jgi:hypothetical protein
VVRSTEEFWRVLAELEDSPEKYLALAEKGKQFAGEWLATPTQTLGQVIERANGRVTV